MKSKFMEKAAMKAHRVGFKIKKHSPEILVVGGVIGGVGATVLACRATIKAKEVLKEVEEQKETINKALEIAKERDDVEYTAEDANNDMKITYVKSGVKIAGLYAPAVILGGLSIGAIFASNNIMRKRNLALGAAYATIDKSFKEYRNRVVERFGEDLDKELKYNTKTVTAKETEVDEEGKKKKVTKSHNVVDPNMYSEFSVVFDEGCPAFNKDDLEENKRFLILQQNYANERLKLKGHLFLNEVYDMIGVPRTKSGQVIGWIYDENNPVGDNFVDFGIFNIEIEKNRDFINHYEKAIILDFNVDGNILEKI